MEGLVNILVPSAGTVSKDDIKLLKEKVFGPSTFWITETKPTDDILEGGVVVGAVSHVTSSESCAASGARELLHALWKGASWWAAYSLLSTCYVQQLSRIAFVIWTHREDHAGNHGACIFWKSLKVQPASQLHSLSRATSSQARTVSAPSAISPSPCCRYGATCGRHARRSLSRPSRASKGCLMAALRSACDPVLAGEPQPQWVVWVVMAASFARHGSCDTLAAVQQNPSAASTASVTSFSDGWFSDLPGQGYTRCPGTACPTLKLPCCRCS